MHWRGRVQNGVRRLRATALAAAGRHSGVRVVTDVLRRDSEVGGTLLAGALAFRLFIWMLPCCLLVAALLGFTASDNRSVDELTQELRMSPLAGSVLAQVGAQAERGRYATALVGVLLLGFTGISLARALDRVRARIWRIPPDQKVGSVLVRAGRYTAVLLAIVVINVVGPVIGTATGIPPVAIVLPSLACFVVLTTLLLSGDWPPSWGQTLPGAVLVALGFEGLHLVAVYYLPGKLARASELYGVLGVAASLLVWLALIARLVVGGQVLNAVLAERATPGSGRLRRARAIVAALRGASTPRQAPEPDVPAEPMPTLSVWRFDTPTGAEDAGQILQSLQLKQLISIHDAATVSWPADATKPGTRQMHELTGPRALGGAFWGMLFGLIFFVPLLGMALGAAASALGESLRGVGIDDEFIKRTREQVTPGTSALFVLTSDAVVDRVRDALKDTRPELLFTNLSTEQERALRDVFAE